MQSNIGWRVEECGDRNTYLQLIASPVRHIYDNRLPELAVWGVRVET